jgi:hypothetical protein
MDINDIKRPGGVGHSFEVPGDAGPEAKRETSFSETAAKIQSPQPTKSLAAIAKFDKSALSDPIKVDAMVRACVSELVESGQNVTGPLSTADKQALLDHLSADPWMRQQVETYLRKVLV